MSPFWKKVFSPLNILFASFLLVVILFTAHAVVYRSRGETHLSRMFITTDNTLRTITFNFDLHEKEKGSFSDFAKNLGQSWMGESIEISLNDALFGLVSVLDNSNFGLKSNSKQLEFISKEPLIVIKEENLESWHFAGNMPQNTILYYQGPQSALVLPSIVRDTTGVNTGAVALFASGENLDGVWVFENIDTQKVEDGLAGLILDSGVEGDQKLTEGVIDGHRVFNLYQQKAPLTIGVINNKLIVTTGDAAFQTIYKVVLGQQNSLVNSPIFSQMTGNWQGSINFYVNTQSGQAVRSLKNVAGLIDFDTQNQDEALSIFSKIKSLVGTLDSDGIARGVVNLY